MLSVRACAVCLASGVKLHTVDSTTNQLLLALSADASAWCAQYTCSECTAHLRKYRRLREKAHRAHALLYELAHAATGQITEADVQAIDRTKYNLQSSLTISNIDHVEINQDGYLIDKAAKPESDALDETKIWILGIDNLKQEPNDWEAGVDNHFTDLSDDEPLKSVAKTIANGKKKVKLKTKKCRIRKKIGNLKQSNHKVVRQKRPKPPRLSTPMKRKTKKELEEFYRRFVSVVPMSQEEAYAEMRKRRDSMNYLSTPHKCELCYRGFKRISTYKNHMLKHDSKLGVFECDFCHFRFNNRHSLLDHFRHFHNLKFSCKRCDYACTNRNLARQHEAWHNGTLYSCKHCDANFSHYTTMQNHVRLKHAVEFPCELCGLCFVGRRGIRVHRLRAHWEHQMTTGEEGHFCAECDVKFASQQAWKRHLVVSAKHNLKENANGCRICGEMFSTPAELMLHRRVHVRKRGPYNRRTKSAVPASDAEKSGDASRARKPRTKKIRPDMMCEACGKVFHTNFDFDTHRRKHTGEKPFKCKYCSKAFALKGILKGHLRTHTQEKPYPCSVCSKAFSERSNMLRHMQLHSEVKPVVCNICEKEFKNTSSMKVHVKYVHMKKPYPARRDRRDRRREQKMPRLDALGPECGVVGDERRPAQMEWTV